MKNSKEYQGGGETGSMYVLNYEVRWYDHVYITLWYVHIPRTDQNRLRYIHLAIAILTL